ncbi:MAG: hypothetical protein PHF37_09715 [Phycisphaerae bacterium]|nr:hypothetical protein [Phycisphaerae bacterium]
MNTVKQSRKGSVLALCVVLILVLALVGLGLARLGSDARVKANKTSVGIVARSAADAGLTQAAKLLKREFAATPTLYSGSVSKCMALCTFAKDAKDADGNLLSNKSLAGTAPGASYIFDVNYISAEKCYLVTSTGTAGTGQKTVYAKLAPSNHIQFFVDTLDADMNNKFAAYSLDPDAPFMIKTNNIKANTINLIKGIIDGDVAVGEGGDASVVSNPDSVSGQIYPSENVYPPNANPPDVSTRKDGPPPVGNDYTITQSGYCWYYDPNTIINVNGGKFVINPNLGKVPVYIEGDMNLGIGGEIFVSNGSSLSLFIGGNLTGKNNIVITNESKDPTKLVIYSTGTGDIDLSLKNNTNFYGGIYAPSSDVTFKNMNQGVFQGMLVSQSLTFKNNGTFYYDPRFDSFDFFGVDPFQLKVVRWWED